MKTITAKEAKQSFGELMDAAQREPVAITKNGKPSTVMLSQADYQRFEAIEDLLWAMRAEAALKRGDYLGVEETQTFIRELLDNARA